MVTKQDIINIFPRLSDDATNPMDGAFCMYTDKNDPDRHCIAGQILVELGLPCPDSSLIAPIGKVIENTWDLHGKFDDGAIEFLGDLQVYADNPGMSCVNPRPWGDVKEWAIEQFGGI